MNPNFPAPATRAGRPPPQERTGRTRTGARKAASQSPRSRARGFALQALYQYLLGGNAPALVDGIDRFTRELTGFSKADAPHYETLLHGCTASADALDAVLAPQLDRPLAEIQPVERICLWIGVYELQHCLDVPYPVVINECVELAKAFGGSDGYKYVNAVLGALAPSLRSAEVQRDRHAEISEKDS